MNGSAGWSTLHLRDKRPKKGATQTLPSPKGLGIDPIATQVEGRTPATWGDGTNMNQFVFIGYVYCILFILFYFIHFPRKWIFNLHLLRMRNGLSDLCYLRPSLRDFTCQLHRQTWQTRKWNLQSLMLLTSADRAAWGSGSSESPADPPQLHCAVCGNH